MEAVVRSLTQALREKRWDAVSAYSEECFERIGARAWSIHLVPPSTRWKVPTPTSVIRMTHSAMSLARLLKGVRPDVVNMHFVTAQSLYWFVLRPFFRYRVVLSAHGSDVLRPSNRMDRVFLPWLLRVADGVTVVSPVIKERVRELTGGQGPEPIVIPNGVDLSFWSPAGSEVGYNEPVVVTVGRMHPVKGHDVLLQAITLVREQIPAVQLRLIGDGPGRQATEEQIRELGLEDTVVLLGTQLAEDVRDELRRAAVFVLPSRSEGMPLSLLEAMAVGCPVVATTVGGVSDLLSGSGIEVAPEDPTALAEALVSILRDADLRQRAAAAAMKRAEGFSWDRSVDAYEALLQTS